RARVLHPGACDGACYGDTVMIPPRPRLPSWLSAVAFLTVTLVASSAIAQGPAPFRVIHTVDKGTQPAVNVSGRVFNDARSDAIDVYVTAEALDASGKVLASGV